MKSLVTVDEFQSLSRKTSPYSEKELMQLASFEAMTLAEKLSDLSYAEKSVVQRLEGENLWIYCAACDVATGRDKERLEKLKLAIPSFQATLWEIESVVNEEAHTELDRYVMKCYMIMKFILANGDRNFTVKFRGEVPKKIFSFRQMSADEWINSITTVYGNVVFRVAYLNGLEAAHEFMFMQIAWHMHRAQPNKYRLDSAERRELLELFRQYVSEFGR